MEELLFVLKEGKSKVEMLQLSKKKILFASFWAVSILGVSRLVAFLREILVAIIFGANAKTDAFAIAFIIPEFFIGLWVAGIGSFILLPLFMGYSFEKHKDKFISLLQTVIVYSILFAGILSVICVIFAPFLISVIAPSFNSTSFASDLLRIMAVSLCFITLSCILTAVHNLYQSFVIPNISILIFNLGVLVTVFMFGYKLGIYAWAFGVVIGSLASCCIQLPILLQKGLISFKFNFRQAELKGIILSIIPIVFSSLILLINMQWDRVLASNIGEGQAFSLYLAGRLVFLPIGILAIPISLIAMPNLIHLRAKAKKDEFKKAIMRLFLLMAVVMFVISIAMIIIRQPLVSLLFERGEFDRSAALLTSDALFGYSLGLVPFSIMQIGATIFYAYNDYMTPFIIGMIICSLNLIISALAIKSGLFGITSATSLAFTVGTLLLILGICKKEKKIYYESRI